VSDHDGPNPGSFEMEGKRVDNYSHYRTISEEMLGDVRDAVDAYSFLNSRWTQGIGVTPQSASATKRALLNATKQLGFQIKMSRDGDEKLGEIHARWYDDEGYLKQLEEADMMDPVPWLSEMVDDLVEAAWRLGYTQAGRIESVPDNEEDQIDKEVSEMFD
jgi:hypothetical protein